MSKLITLILIVVPIICNAQFQVMNSNTNKTLEDVYFINTNIGIAVGDSGTVVRSIDGGVNWNTVLSIDTTSFSKVAFFDAQHGVIVGNDIYTSSDAGLTWTLRVKGPSNWNYGGDLEILNDSVCLASNSHVQLLRSTNKGQSWDTISTNAIGNSFVAMSFINDSIGFANSSIGPPNIGILKTIDGGFTWDTVMSNSAWNNTVLEDMVFINENKGFQVGWYNAHFLKTENGGTTWNFPNSDSNSAAQLIDLDIRTNRPNSYYACGWYGEILKSNDGGNNWQRIDNGIIPNTLKGIHFHNDTLGWVVGDQGVILRTTNGGGVLSLQDYSPIFFSVFPNPTHNQLNISIPQKETEKSTIELLDLNGRTLIRTSTSNNSIQLNTSQLAKSLYIIRIKSGNRMGFRKVLVQ